jgi:hypothetical protein
VQLAYPRITVEQRRRWIGLAVALTVTFTVCDARQINLSLAGDDLLPLKGPSSTRMTPAEQKAPQELGTMSTSPQIFASREQVFSAPHSFDGSKCFRYSLISVATWLQTLCSERISSESTRGPPLMDPPTSC